MRKLPIEKGHINGAIIFCQKRDVSLQQHQAGKGKFAKPENTVNIDEAVKSPQNAVFAISHVIISESYSGSIQEFRLFTGPSILIRCGGVLTVFGQGLKAQLTLVNAPVSSGAISFPQIQ